ncbi:site-specific integrase [Arcticibacter tournemirensis]
MYYQLSDFESLVESAVLYIRQKGRSEATINHFKWQWEQVRQYLKKREMETFSARDIMGYCNDKFGTTDYLSLKKYQHDCARQLLCLAEFIESGQMPDALRVQHADYDVRQWNPVFSAFMEEKRRQQRRTGTIYLYKCYLCNFLRAMLQQEINAPAMLNSFAIAGYITHMYSQSKGAKEVSLRVIKVFLSYLYANRLTDKDFSTVVPRGRFPKRSEVPSVYTPDELQKILSCADRSTRTGKRDYAFLLITYRLGLRISDLVSLKLQNINWECNELSFIQVKTGNPVTLPVPEDVGNALIDYLRYCRPNVPASYVFVSRNYPYGKLCPKLISQVIRSHIRASGIDTGNRKTGAHAFRHSMAYNLLAAKTQLPVISEIMGHSVLATTMCYLRIDIESLRACALEVPSFPCDFYQQKGGFFYE